MQRDVFTVEVELGMTTLGTCPLVLCSEGIRRQRIPQTPKFPCLHYLPPGWTPKDSLRGGRTWQASLRKINDTFKFHKKQCFLIG